MPQITVNVPDLYEIKVRGLIVHRSIAGMPQASIDYLFNQIAIPRIVTSPGGVVKGDSPEAVVAASEAKWADLMKGVLRKTRSAKFVDAALTIAMGFAKADLDAKITKKKAKTPGFSVDKANYKELLAKQFESLRTDYMARAEIALQESAAAADDEDLDDFFDEEEEEDEEAA